MVRLHAHGYAGLTEGSPLGHVWSRIAGASVPVFFLADGYLFARSLTPERPWRYGAYLAKSARRLLVPWAVLTLAYTALRAVFEAVGFFPTRLVVGRAPAEVAANIYQSRVAMQMYFLVSLFLIRGLSPALRRVALGGRWVAPAATVAWIGALGASRLILALPGERAALGVPRG